VDLDPTHNFAIWVALLGHLHQRNVEEARSAFKQAMRVRQLLSPDLDTSSVTSFLTEVDSIDTDNDEISRLMKEIRDALDAENSESN
ncbi:MAG TPA: hypothetical protein VJ742_02515, partial [Nitrososphaera sp.]|nr:hypothetical protein [Nitrososphaera sp.]